MPDISMCANDECPLAWKCWRKLAPPDKYQTYADFRPDSTGNCPDFWDLKP